MPEMMRSDDDELCGHVRLCSLLVGIIIGSGIFTSPGVVLLDAGSVGLGLTAWVAAAFMAMCSALVYAELGAALPQAGGNAEFFRVMLLLCFLKLFFFFLPPQCGQSVPCPKQVEMPNSWGNTLTMIPGLLPLWLISSMSQVVEMPISLGWCSYHASWTTSSHVCV